LNSTLQPVTHGPNPASQAVTWACAQPTGGEVSSTSGCGAHEASRRNAAAALIARPREEGAPRCRAGKGRARVTQGYPAFKNGAHAGLLPTTQRWRQAWCLGSHRCLHHEDGRSNTRGDALHRLSCTSHAVTSLIFCQSDTMLPRGVRANCSHGAQSCQP
jgi:hypothetical protein